MPIVKFRSDFQVGAAKKQLAALRRSASKLDKQMAALAGGSARTEKGMIRAGAGAKRLDAALLAVQARSELASRKLRVMARSAERSDRALDGAAAAAIRFGAATAKAGAKAARLSRRLPDLTRNVQGLKSGMAGAAAATAVMISAAVAGSGRLVRMASDVSEAENLFRESMGSMEASARRFSVEQAKALGVNEFSLRSMIGGLNLFVSNMGIAEAQSVTMSQKLAVLAQDMASFRNADPNDVFVRLRSALGGSSEAVDQFGINLRASALDLELQRLGLAKSTRTASEAAKVQARYSIILRSTAKDQGDLIRTSAAFANQSRRLVTNLTVLGTKYGQVLLPAIEAGVRGLNVFLESIDFNERSIREWQFAVLAGAMGAARFSSALLGGVESLATHARMSALAGQALAQYVRTAGLAVDALSRIPGSPIPEGAGKPILVAADAMQKIGKAGDIAARSLQSAAGGAKRLADSLQVELSKALADNLAGVRASGAAARQTGQDYRSLGDSIRLAAVELDLFSKFFTGQIQSDQARHQQFLQSFSQRFQLPSNPFAPSETLGSQFVEPQAAFDPNSFGGGPLPEGAPGPGLPGLGAGIFPPAPEIEPYRLFFGEFSELLTNTAPTVDMMSETMGRWAGAMGHATEAIFGLATGGKAGVKQITQSLAAMGTGMVKDAKIRIPMHLALAAASATGWGKHLGPAKDHLKAAAMFGVAAAFGGKGKGGGSGGSGGGGGSGSASGPEGPTGRDAVFSVTRDGLLIQSSLRDTMLALQSTMGKLTAKPGDVLVRDTFAGNDAGDLVGDKGSADLGFAGSGAPPGGGGFNS